MLRIIISLIGWNQDHGLSNLMDNLHYCTANKGNLQKLKK